MASLPAKSPTTPSTLQVTLLSEKLVKPSSPTPSTQRWHKLSLLDQALTNIYIPFALFYTKQQIADNNNVAQILEKSLSETLTSYYPYAGRLHHEYDDSSCTIVDCDDTGAEFLQVKINCPISEALNWHKAAIEDAVFPEGLPWANFADRRLVVAQLSYFNCGGIAISLCFSHKIGDACSCYHMFRDWAEGTRISSIADANYTKLPSLYFVQQSIFPSDDGPLISPVIKSDKKDCVQRRYIFSPSKLRELKALVAAEEATVQNPTRTEVVNALLFKSVLTATTTSGSLIFPSTIVQYIDLRDQLNFPRNVVGNILTSYHTSIYNEEEMKLTTIVREMRKGKEQAFNRDNVKQNALIEEILTLASSKEMYHNSAASHINSIYILNSLVKFPLHEIDFGWGKPTKVSIANGPLTKVVYLMGNQSGGIDAFVMLSEQDMSVLERDTHLLEFASLVPSS